METKQPSLVMVDGRTMAYDEVSPPNPKGTILLLTGLGSNRLGWNLQLNEFGQHYRTISLDHRDTGDSDYVSEPYRTVDQADDAAAVLKALGVTKAHIIGISMGGFIALNLVVRHPDIVDKLVLVATSAGGKTHTPASAEILAMLVQPYPDPDRGAVRRRTYSKIMAPGYAEREPAIMDEIAENGRYRPQTQDAYFRQIQAIATHDVTGQLAQIHAPTLVVHGTADPLVPPQNGQYLADRIPGAKLLAYPDTGHILIVERAADFNRDVVAFLDS